MKGYLTLDCLVSGTGPEKDACGNFLLVRVTADIRADLVSAYYERAQADAITNPSRDRVPGPFMRVRVHGVSEPFYVIGSVEAFREALAKELL